MTGPSVERALLELPDATRDEARAAIEWLLPEDDDEWDGLLQLTLQGFLWYSLPMKWLTDSAHHHEVAWALGDLFAAAGLERYAGLCRSTATHELIGRWETDPEAARAQFHTLMADSGVDPPDIGLLIWGQLQSLTEHAASLHVSAALEAAVDAGSLVPGRRGWRSVATSVTERTLEGPDPHGEHPRLLDAVEAARCKDWLSDLRRRTAMSDDDAAALMASVAPSSDADLGAVGASLEPLTWFLRRIGDGVTMTEAGYLPRPLALDADERYNWFGLKPKFTVRGERDLPELMLVHRLARDARLVTLRGRRLTVSARGRKALDDERLLPRVVLTKLFDPTTWRGDAAIGVAVALVCADLTQRFASSDLDAALHRHLRARWRRGTTALAVDDVRGAGGQLRTAAQTFAWFAPTERGAWDLAPRLTDVGRQACLLGLRGVACGPRPAL
ncbi:hypothetical protein [Cellulomonas sp. KRMCY2]|uniref:hypothetical protein n=1 Tax=Cellulomonas sp. KRMCY2 TaxID=1304865 RepID=UPI00045EB7D9|nr:hypothetical protein [Cellulomonas sp. KRMCY2]